MRKPLKLGIIGCGIVGESAVANMALDERVSIVAATDVSAERSRATASRTQARAYTNVDEMLHRESLDVALVATPDAHHRGPAIQVAEAGVPYLLMQKPLATSVEDAYSIAEAAKATECCVYMLFSNRFDAMDLATRYAVQQGLIGAPNYGEARLDDNICVPTSLWGERSRSWAEQSSPAQFLLSHVVDQVRWYFQPAEVEAVYAISQQTILGFTPDLYDAYLFLDNGMNIRLKAEWTKHMGPRVEFYLYFAGSKGSITYHKLPGFNARLGWRAEVDAAASWSEILDHRRVLNEHQVRCHASMERGYGDGGDVDKQVLTIENNHSIGVYRVVIDAIVEDTLQPSILAPFGRLPTLEDGVRTTEVVCAIEESAAQRSEIVLPPHASGRARIDAASEGGERVT